MLVAPVLLLNVPKGHKEHAREDVAASVELYVPAGQYVHREEPGVSLKVPLGQAVQLTKLPVTFCKYPAAHLMGGKTTPLCTPWPAENSS